MTVMERKKEYGLGCRKFVKSINPDAAYKTSKQSGENVETR